MRLEDVELSALTIDKMARRQKLRRRRKCILRITNHVKVVKWKADSQLATIRDNQNS